MRSNQQLEKTIVAHGPSGRMPFAWRSLIPALGVTPEGA